MATTFIPQLINQTESKTTKEQVTHERWNELFNLIISQGDHNSNAISTIVDTDLSSIETNIDNIESDVANLFSNHDSQATLISNLSSLVSTNEDDIEGKMTALKGTGYVDETVKGNANDIATLDSKVDTNELDIEGKVSDLVTALGTHKDSADHDERYYTETEMDALLNTLKGTGWTTENLVNLQTQINNLNDMYSTDQERIQAINDVIEAFENADTSLETMIDNRVDDLAGAGRTTETVKQNADDIASHEHDDRYYTETEVDNALNLKVDMTLLTSDYLDKSVLATEGVSGFMSYLDKRKLNALDHSATFDYQSMYDALETHKGSEDHNDKYYTELEIDSKLSPLESHIINSGIHPAVSNLLLKDNTTAFTPTGDYHPSTKKYVDDEKASLESIMLTADTSTVAVPLPAEAENDLQSQIADKISQATLDAHTTNSVDAHGIDTKAEQVDLIAHENNSTDAHGINNKTDQVDFAEHTGDIHAHNLDSKADVTYVNDQLSEKADVTYVNDQLSEKADVTYVDNLTAEDIDAMDLGRFYSTTTVEGILNEIGQELKEVSFTTHTQTESIKSLPTGSIDENVSNFEAEGLSLVNSVKNGDFSDGTTGWASNHGSLVISNKVASHTGSGSSAGPYLGNFPKMTIKEGDKVYLFTKNRVTNANCNSISFSFRGSTGGSTTSAISIISPVQNKWYEMQRVLTIPPNYSGKLELYIYHFYADATTANGKVMEVDGNAGVHAINMTALGIEDYTEEQMLDLVRSGYIDGLENVESPKVESVGKNLFDVLSDITTYGTIIDRGIDSFTFVPDILTRNGFFRVQVKRNTDYRLSWNAIEDTVGNGVMAIFSDDVVPIVGYTTSKNFQLNSGENDVIRVYFRNHIAIEPITFKDIQLEEGSTATAYEPYKSSQLTANVPLRSLPNGVKDRIYEADGQMWLEKNVEEISLLSGQVINTTNIPLASTASSYIAHQTDGTTLTGVVDGTDTLTADATIHYELETPELINLTEQGLTSGELMSFENGTVYNSSDTFHSPNLSFDVVTDRNVQLDAKVDQTEFDAHKAEMAKLTINLDSLSGWFAKVASVNTSPLKLMIVGDSISEGWSATNFQNYGYVGVLRDKITALMSPSLKPGMFYPVARYYKSGSRVFSVIDKNSVTLNMTARLVNDLVEDSTYARLVSGDILSFDSQDEYSYISESHDALEIIYKRKPDGGRFTISNGTYSETIDTNGTTALIKHQIPNVGSTAYHVWTITAIDDGLTVDIYGLTTFLSGNISRGGIIYNTSRYGTTAGFNSILASAIAPDLTIITHGSNDFESQVDPDAYYDKIVTSGNYAEASGSSVLLASIGTRSFGSKALCQEVYVQKMQDAAHNNGWGFINLHKMWGGYAGAKAESYLAADDTHPLNTGHTSIGNIIWSYIKEL